MSKRGKAQNSEEPGRIDTVSQLNDVYDKLREVQLMTSFLGTALTDCHEKYSDEIMYGAKLCFDMLDTRIETTMGNLEEITAEVKQHESH